MNRQILALAVIGALFAGCHKGAPPARDARQATAAEPDTESKPPGIAELDTRGSDYGRMRSELAATEGYNAYGIQIVEKVLIDEAMAAWKAGEVVVTTEKLNEVLEVNPLSIEAHRRLADMYEVILQQFAADGTAGAAEEGAASEDQMRSALAGLETRHRAMADGLVRSITDSGDGMSPATAYVVISIPEEYMTMFYLKLKVKGQALVHEGDKSYDVLHAEDAAGADHEIYFDISAFAK